MAFSGFQYMPSTQSGDMKKPVVKQVDDDTEVMTKLKAIPPFLYGSFSQHF